MSSTITRHVVLNSIDAPLKILIWTKAELGVFILPALLGLMFRHMLIGIILSFVNYRLYKLYQERFGKDQLGAVCYWFLPPAKKRFPAIPPSFIRHYKG